MRRVGSGSAVPREMPNDSGDAVTVGARAARRLRVVQVSFYRDPERRAAEALLRAWPTLHGVAAGAARAGVDVTIVQAAARRESLRRDGVRYELVDDAPAAPIRLPGGIPVHRRPGRLLDIVASLAPEVVHVHGFYDPVAVQQLASALRPVPVLLQDHGSRLPHGWRRPIWLHVWRHACHGLAGVAFTAREQAVPFVQAGVLPSALPVFEVLEGSSPFSPGDRAAARRATGLHGDPCFLWTAHLDENKDPLTALDAFALAAPRMAGARLWCCYGRAPLLDAVKRRIAGDLVLRERVTLLGRRPHEEMEQLFRAADFFVQTSHTEGSGYSILEALSCGTPPLVTDIPATRRIVGRGGAGSLTPVGDAPALAEAMVAWARCEREPLRCAARAWFEQALTFDVIGRELRAAYETLAGRTASGAGA